MTPTCHTEAVRVPYAACRGSCVRGDFDRSRVIDARRDRRRTCGALRCARLCTRASAAPKMAAVLEGHHEKQAWSSGRDTRCQHESDGWAMGGFERVQAACAPFEALAPARPKAGPLGSRTPPPHPMDEAGHRPWALRGVASAAVEEHAADGDSHLSGTPVRDRTIGPAQQAHHRAHCDRAVSGKPRITAKDKV